MKTDSAALCVLEFGGVGDELMSSNRLSGSVLKALVLLLLLYWHSSLDWVGVRQ